MDNKEITQVPHFKFLGVIVDEKLTWKLHIEQVCKKTMKSIGILGPSFVARRKVAQGGAAGAVQVSSGAARRAVSLAVW